MGQLSQNEATQIWIAATDHSQAVLAVEQSERKAKATGSSEDDMKAMKARMDLDAVRARLKHQLDTHVGEK